MAAVVRARRDLVDEQPAVGELEHLDGDHADVAERLGDRHADLLGALLAGVGVIGAGARVVWRMWRRWTFSASG